MTKPYIRESLLKFLKNVFSKFIIITLISVFTYVLLAHYILYKFYVWNIFLIKDSIYWFLGTALVLFINSNKAYEKGFFTDILYDNLKLLIIVEFIVNFYSFSFIVEMVFIPIIFFISAFSGVNKVIHKNIILDKIFNFMLFGFGLMQLIYVIYKIVTDYKSIVNNVSLGSIILYPLLTILYLPFIYFFALYLKYNTIYSVITGGLKQRQELVKKAKRNIFFICRFNLRKLNIFHKTSVYKFFDAESLDDVINITSYFKRFWKKYKVRYLNH